MDRRKVELNGWRKWGWRLGVIVSIIIITTFFNQIYSIYYDDINKHTILEYELKEVCKKVLSLEEKIENIEIQINEMNLKRETSLAEIQTKLVLILKKIDRRN